MEIFVWKFTIHFYGYGLDIQFVLLTSLHQLKWS